MKLVKKYGMVFLVALLCVSFFAGITEKSAAEEKVVLEFFNMKIEIQDIMNDIIADFEEKYPYIDIEQNVVSDPTQVLQARMASNDTPDIFTQWPNASFFYQVDAGYVMDLTGEKALENIQESALEAYKYNGKDYIAPISYNTMGIVYNKQIFEELGLDIPTTFSELQDICEKLKNNGYTPFIIAGQEPQVTVQLTQVFLASMKNYPALKENAMAGTFDPDSVYGRELKEVAEKMIFFVNNAQNSVVGTGYTQSINDFATEKGAMIVNGSWILPSVKAANPELEIGMFPIPADKAENTKVTAFPGDMAIAIAADTEYPEEAKLFLEYMTEVETARRYARAEGNPSCIIGVDYVAPELEYQYSFIKKGRFVVNPDAYWPYAKQEAVGVATQELLIKKDADRYLEAMTDAFNNN